MIRVKMQLMQIFKREEEGCILYCNCSLFKYVVEMEQKISCAGLR